MCVKLLPRGQIEVRKGGKLDKEGQRGVGAEVGGRGELNHHQRCVHRVAAVVEELSQRRALPGSTCVDPVAGVEGLVHEDRKGVIEVEPLRGDGVVVGVEVKDKHV